MIAFVWMDSGMSDSESSDPWNLAWDDKSWDFTVDRFRYQPPVNTIPFFFSRQHADYWDQFCDNSIIRIQRCFRAKKGKTWKNYGYYWVTDWDKVDWKLKVCDQQPIQFRVVSAFP